MCVKGSSFFEIFIANGALFLRNDFTGIVFCEVVFQGRNFEFFCLCDEFLRHISYGFNMSDFVVGKEGKFGVNFIE